MINLLDLLDLRTVDLFTYEGPASHEDHARTFGGHLLAQSLVAAGSTVEDDRPCHSMHAYFLRPGSTESHITYNVDNVRDGRSFSMRSLDAVQGGKSIFHMMASFHVREPVEARHAETPPDTPAPTDLESLEERLGGRRSSPEVARWFDRLPSFDVRFIGQSAFDEGGERVNRSQLWVRSTLHLGDDQLMHRAVFAFVSDLAILDPILLAHGRRWTDAAILGASLDHAIWFHEDLDMGEWHLFDHWSPIAANNRGLARTIAWDQQGRLVATVAQEALLRPPDVRSEA